MALDKLRRDLADLQAFEQRDQAKVDSHRGAKDDGLAGGADGVFDFVGPDILDGLWLSVFLFFFFLQGRLRVGKLPLHGPIPAH